MHKKEMVKNMEKLYIVIPAYNEKDTIKQIIFYE